MDHFHDRLRLLPPPRARHRTGPPDVSPAIPHVSWQHAMSPDRRWALICDAEGRNLAEIHRPALTTGPEGRTRTFEEVVRLMAAAPELLAVLDRIASSRGLDPGVARRARAMLSAIR
jgi:hypothetical protein